MQIHSSYLFMQKFIQDKTCLENLLVPLNSPPFLLFFFYILVNSTFSQTVLLFIHPNNCFVIQLLQITANLQVLMFVIIYVMKYLLQASRVSKSTFGIIKSLTNNNMKYSCLSLALKPQISKKCSVLNRESQLEKHLHLCLKKEIFMQDSQASKK